MPYPTEPSAGIPTVASDANYSDVGQPWNGQPTKVAPTTAVQTQGFKPASLLPGDILGYLFNTVSAWLTFAKDAGAYLRDNYMIGAASSTDNAIVRFDGTGGKTAQNSGIQVTDTPELAYTTPPTRTTFIHAVTRQNESAAFAAGGYGDVTINANSGVMFYDLSQHLPDGAVVTGVAVMIDPGAARAGANRTRLLLERSLRDITTPGAGSQVGVADVYDNAGAALQLILSGTVSVTITKSTGEMLQARVFGGNDAGANPDLVYGVRITWTDPGPRNF